MVKLTKKFYSLVSRRKKSKKRKREYFNIGGAKPKIYGHITTLSVAGWGFETWGFDDNELTKFEYGYYVYDFVDVAEQKSKIMYSKKVHEFRLNFCKSYQNYLEDENFVDELKLYDLHEEDYFLTPEGSIFSLKCKDTNDGKLTSKLIYEPNFTFKCTYDDEGKITSIKIIKQDPIKLGLTEPLDPINLNFLIDIGVITDIKDLEYCRKDLFILIKSNLKNNTNILDLYPYYNKIFALFNSIISCDSKSDLKILQNEIVLLNELLKVNIDKSSDIYLYRKSIPDIRGLISIKLKKYHKIFKTFKSDHDFDMTKIVATDGKVNDKSLQSDFEILMEYINYIDKNDLLGVLHKIDPTITLYDTDFKKEGKNIKLIISDSKISESESDLITISLDIEQRKVLRENLIKLAYDNNFYYSENAIQNFWNINYNIDESLFNNYLHNSIIEVLELKEEESNFFLELYGYAFMNNYTKELNISHNIVDAIDSYKRGLPKEDPRKDKHSLNFIQESKLFSLIKIETKDPKGGKQFTYFILFDKKDGECIINCFKHPDVFKKKIIDESEKPFIIENVSSEAKFDKKTIECIFEADESYLFGEKMCIIPINKLDNIKKLSAMYTPKKIPSYRQISKFDAPSKISYYSFREVISMPALTPQGRSIKELIIVSNTSIISKLNWLKKQDFHSKNLQYDFYNKLQVFKDFDVDIDEIQSNVDRLEQENEKINGLLTKAKLDLENLQLLSKKKKRI